MPVPGLRHRCGLICMSLGPLGEVAALVLTFFDLRKALCQFVKMLPFHGAIHDVDVADQKALQLLRATA
jgi:hypothetical protein